MRNYGQFCPIARGSGILAERWTPIILRNVLLGCRTFNQIAAGAPGLSRALLAKRLRELEEARVIDVRPKPDGHGSLYEPTAAGRGLWPVLTALGSWAEEWMQVTPEHASADVVLWSWCESFLRHDRLPDRRIVVRFEFSSLGRRLRAWLLVERREAEICSFDPGFDNDLVVTIHDSLVFARWHLGLIEWAAALRSGGIEVAGPRDLCRALPTWNAGPEVHARLRVERERMPGCPALPPLGAPREGERVPSRHVSEVRPAQCSSIPDFTGRLVTPDDPAYDGVRAVWNGAIDHRPRLIARCSSDADVIAALRFGRSSGLAISVRGGGHGVAGTAVCDGGLVIDLSPMKRITVDPAPGIARAQPGVLWGELDAATQAFGLATTGGVVSHTGISGLTLGGGLGWLMRRYGLTVDNLLEARVVTADGKTLTASERDHTDLFWGLRGGGGGLGIATSFTYRLHPVGPEVLAGSVLWPLEEAPQVLRAYRDFVASAPCEVASGVTLRRAPASPSLPVELHRRPVCSVALLALGEDRLLAPMRTFGRPLLDLVKRRPYTGLQSMMDATVPHGWHYYWKSTGLRELSDRAIDAMVDHAARATSVRSYATLIHLGGAIAEIDPDSTAYSRRSVPYELHVNGVWLPHEPIGGPETAWARNFVAALESDHAGVYVNFMDRDDGERTASAFGSEAYRRLTALRQAVDPDRVFSGPAERRVL
jgi:FAD/FMN-containing dehydrogenase/DNA-binding HxlR family transcriptional regulator